MAGLVLDCIFRIVGVKKKMVTDLQSTVAVHAEFYQKTWPCFRHNETMKAPWIF